MTPAGFDFEIFKPRGSNTWKLTPHTDAARQWIDEHISHEDRQYVGPSLLVNQSFIENIVWHITEDDLTIVPTELVQHLIGAEE